jgi:serine/threonine protein kinase
MRIGPYEVLARLGAGGMGEVYSARDSVLQRDVALKILPADVMADADRLARFRREAQLLAALNHPNIAHVFGIERSDGSPPAIAMELVPGRTLEDLLHPPGAARTDGRTARLPISDVVPIGRQLAAALEAAHESGIIHRDLKPSNVKVRDDGVVKVLDFGLAKADEGRSGGSGVTEGVTISSPAMTGMGQILGTAAYMSPEQARGRPLDKRSDIWAYGVVLFEVVTGERLFDGHSVTETLASVLKDEIDLGRLPADTPAALRGLIARCLERDPQLRLRDIGEARILLSRPLDTRTPTSNAAGTSRGRVPWGAAVAGALLLAAIAAAIVWAIRPNESRSIRRLDLAVPAGLSEAAVSNDGASFAYLADNQLHVRRLDELETRTLGPVHVTARQLVWSPDDRAIAYAVDSRIETMPVAGGAPFVVTRIPASGRVMSMAWLPDDTLLFAVWRDSLYRVPASGGTASVALAIDAADEVDFHHAGALLDGRFLLATHQRQEDADIVELVSLGNPGTRTVITRDPDLRLPRTVPVGRVHDLLFIREGTNPGLWSTPFVERELDFNRASLLVGDASSYTVARDGTVLALVPARQRRALTWIDLQGTESPAAGGEIEGTARAVELSPDGLAAAYTTGTIRRAGASGGSLQGGVVLVRDLQTGADRRLTTSAPSSSWTDIGVPTWSPDGERLIHRSGPVENGMLVDIRTDVGGSPRTLVPGIVGRMLPDGRTLIYSRDERGNGFLMRISIGADGKAGAAEPLFSGADAPRAVDFDLPHDAGLIAFVVDSREGLRRDVWIADMKNPQERFLVQEGASRPRFTRDGRTLYFNRGAVDAQGRSRGELARVSIVRAPRLSFGPAEVVLIDRPGGPSLGSYDISPDGTRLLAFKPVAPRPEEGRRLVLVERR